MKREDCFEHLDRIEFVVTDVRIGRNICTVSVSVNGSVHQNGIAQTMKAYRNHGMEATV